MKVLAGDIGGTKTIMAVAAVEGSRVSILEERLFPSRQYEDFTRLAREFLKEIDDVPTHACFGVAGPVVQERSVVTKLPWVLVAPDLRRDLGLQAVRLINDFVAIAFGIEALDGADLEVLNEGERDPEGPIAVIGAGTGLGESIRMNVSGRPVVLSSEGGHTDFGARNELEIDFLRFMLAKYRRVSYDRVLSGPGIADIYSFFRDTGREAESDELRRALEDADDAPPVIRRFADERNDPLCNRTLDLFVSIYGAEAGNLALKAVSTGGVYVAGGIAPRMVERLKRGEFRRSFVTKGRLSPVVEKMPVHVILDKKVGLLGAAIAAADSIHDPRFEVE